jgi:hypothetical protein
MLQVLTGRPPYYNLSEAAVIQMGPRVLFCLLLEHHPDAASRSILMPSSTSLSLVNPQELRNPMSTCTAKKSCCFSSLMRVQQT